jgi:hypothetical protein
MDRTPGRRDCGAAEERICCEGVSVVSHALPARRSAVAIVTALSCQPASPGKTVEAPSGTVIQGAASGSRAPGEFIQITVEIRSAQPVTFIGYVLMFPVCAKLEHAPARWLKYGDRSVLDEGESGRRSEPPVAPRGRAELILTRDDLQMFQRTIERTCPGKGPPELPLGVVLRTCART